MAKSSCTLPSAGNMVPVCMLPTHAGNILALPRTVLHVQELSYTCRNYMQIAINCPTHAGNVKCSGTAQNCPTCARIICRLPEGVPHLQEIFLHCERLSFMCRNYSCIIYTCWNYFKFLPHVQEVWELFLNHTGSLKTVLHISYSCKCRKIWELFFTFSCTCRNEYYEN